MPKNNQTETTMTTDAQAAAIQALMGIGLSQDAATEQVLKTVRKAERDATATVRETIAAGLATDAMEPIKASLLNRLMEQVATVETEALQAYATTVGYLLQVEVPTADPEASPTVTLRTVYTGNRKASGE